MRRFVSVEHQTILDVGCGLGMYVRAFPLQRGCIWYGHRRRKAGRGSHDVPNLCVALAEALPYPDGAFDVVLSHEVIEHVADDRQAVAEAVRLLRNPDPSRGRPGGRLVIFAPNRLYAFETHGAYWAGRYHAGNIPLVNYLPGRWRERFCPHVRAYTRRDLRRLLDGLPVRVIVHTEVFPGYDKIERRRPTLGRWFRRITYFLENTPLRLLGLSHLLVLEKTV